MNNSHPVFIRKTLIVISLFFFFLLFFLFVGYARNVLLLFFASILIAAFLRGMAHLLNRYLTLPFGWALGAVYVGIFLITGLGVWFLEGRITLQVDQMRQEWGLAVSAFRDWAGSSKWGQQLAEILAHPQQILSHGIPLLPRAADAFSSILSILGGALMIFVVSLYLSISPELYLNGLLSLIPVSNRPKVKEALTHTACTLRQWLMGQLIAMSLVGILTGLGLWFLDIPLPITLGVLSGLLDFIPNFGPIFAAIPGVLFGLMRGPIEALYVMMLYLGVQLIESNILVPLIQKKMIKLPPALLIITQLILGTLSGFLGLIFATPLIAAGIVLIKDLYVTGVLEKDSEPGEK